MLGGGQVAIARQLRRRAVAAAAVAPSPPPSLLGRCARGRGRRWASSSSSSSSSRDATATTATATAATPQRDPDDDQPTKRPTRQTFAQFVELARPETPAFLTALLAVAVVGWCGYGDGIHASGLERPTHVQL